MGASASKPARAAPVRFVAREIKNDKVPLEIQFKKKTFTAQGINQRTEDVITTPSVYMETELDSNSTYHPDAAAPRWYLNTYLEMIENQRVDRVFLSGTLPSTWWRDKHESYDLIRNRIDDEDLDWVLKPENRKLPVEELASQTKLDAQALQDILDTVELPRRQYRNYKGKIVKSIDDSNDFIKSRKEQIARAKEAEVLKNIGYSDEEVKKEEQYLTQRSRGVKVLDDLGVSLRASRRRERSQHHDEMEQMLTQRQIDAIESGKAVVNEEELKQPKYVMGDPYRKPPRTGNTNKKLHLLDSGKDVKALAKIRWWLEKGGRIRRGYEKIYGVEKYNERMQVDMDQFDKGVAKAREKVHSYHSAHGVQQGIDPMSGHDALYDALKEAANASDDEQARLGLKNYTDVIEDDEKYIVHQFPHTKHHEKPKPENVRQNLPYIPIDPDYSAWERETQKGVEEAFQAKRELMKYHEMVYEKKVVPPPPEPGASLGNKDKEQ
jgi:hypothetical protein